MDDCEEEHDGREDCCEDEGAQCDDEGAIDCDREPEADADSTPCYVSREDSEATKKAAQALLDGLRERTKRHDQGLVLHSTLGRVS